MQRREKIKRTRKGKKSRRDIKLKEPDFLHPVRKHQPTRYREEMNRQVFFLCLLGANDVQIAQVLNISPRTLSNWKETKPKFLESLRRGKAEADSKVAHALYQAALGYSHPDVHILTNRKKEYDPETGKVIREWTEPLMVETVKHYPPNVQAAIKWLQARSPETWGNKIEIDKKVSHTHRLDLSEFSTEELKVLNKLGVVEEVTEDAVIVAEDELDRMFKEEELFEDDNGGENNG